MEIEIWVYVLKPDLAGFPTWAKENEALTSSWTSLFNKRNRLNYVSPMSSWPAYMTGWAVAARGERKQIPSSLAVSHIP
jgi:hypothetical protein